MRLIKSGEYEQFGRIYGVQIYGYLLGITLFTIAGMTLQSCFVPDKKDDKLGDKNNSNNEGTIKVDKSNTDQTQDKNVKAEVKEENLNNVKAEDKKEEQLPEKINETKEDKKAENPSA